jgi:pyruvate/2-oxoglutarate dehydrogenase complex dihydrolipoamide dehydrogenase (E3) component
VLVDKEGKEQTLEADTVVIAAGTRRSTLEATREGYLAELSI